MTTSIMPYTHEDHYEEICRWWCFHDWTPIPRSHLSTIGFVVLIDNTLASAGWLYLTNSAFSWMEFIIANPDVRKEARSYALSALIDEIKTASKARGFKSIYMSAENNSLIERLKRHGFEVSEKGMTNLICHAGEI